MSTRHSIALGLLLLAALLFVIGAFPTGSSVNFTSLGYAAAAGAGAVLIAG